MQVTPNKRSLPSVANVKLAQLRILVAAVEAAQCDIVYTPFLNLKKEDHMEVGQAGSRTRWGFPKIRGTYYNGESNGKENGK